MSLEKHNFNNSTTSFCANEIDKEKSISSNLTEVVLFDSKNSAMLNNAVSTLTFFNGSPPIEKLRNKVQNIIAKNPWLRGSLTKKGSHIFLTFDPDREPTLDDISLSNDPELKSEMNYEEIFSRVERHSVGTGYDCLKRHSPLLHVSVITTSPNSFALFFSISHAIADAHTYYKLFGMLDEKREAESLDITRSADFEACAAQIGSADFESWTQSWGLFWNVSKNLVFGTKRTPVLKTVDIDWIQTQKASFLSQNSPVLSDSFISTNDIVTSCFFKATDCDIGIMAMNCRNKLPEWTNYHAGNCIKVIAYQREDFSSPGLIREGISLGRGVISGRFPSFFRSLSTRCSLLTNWSSVSTDVELEGCLTVLHLPSGGGRLTRILNGTGIIFKPTKTTLAILMCGDVKASVFDEHPCFQQV